jgi:hypothetical protein
LLPGSPQNMLPGKAGPFVLIEHKFHFLQFYIFKCLLVDLNNNQKNIFDSVYV